MKLCWACRAVSVLMATNTIDDFYLKVVFAAGRL